MKRIKFLRKWYIIKICKILIIALESRWDCIQEILKIREIIPQHSSSVHTRAHTYKQTCRTTTGRNTIAKVTIQIFVFNFLTYLQFIPRLRANSQDDRLRRDATRRAALSISMMSYLNYVIIIIEFIEIIQCSSNSDLHEYFLRAIYFFIK